MSLFWGFCPILLNSPQIPRLLHCCDVLSDELSPVNVEGQISIHTYIDALLTISEEKPGLRPQCQCQVFHCGTVTGMGNYSASFSTISWPFLLGGGEERWPSTYDQENCGLQKNSNVGEEVTLSKHVTAPWRDYQLTAHCDIEYSEILPRPPAKHSHCVHCHPLEEVRGDTGVTSINNYPDTAHRGLGRHDVTTADGCVLCCARLTGGAPGDSGHVFGRNDT